MKKDFTPNFKKFETFSNKVIMKISTWHGWTDRTKISDHCSDSDRKYELVFFMDFSGILSQMTLTGQWFESWVRNFLVQSVSFLDRTNKEPTELVRTFQMDRAKTDRFKWLRVYKDSRPIKSTEYLTSKPGQVWWNFSAEFQKI